MRVGSPLKDVRQTVLYFSDDLYHYYMENFQTIDARLTFVNAAATSVQHTRNASFASATRSTTSRLLRH